MNAPAAPATAHFVEKWLQREPEMRIAAAFCARADGDGDAAAARARFDAWGALLHELREALFELPDAGVAMAKRGWWAEELHLIASGRARHPLGEALQALPEARALPWTGLALALMAGGGEARPADTTQALAALLPLAQATVAVENAAFHARDEGQDAARALAVHWLLQRMPRGLADEDGARVPMHLLARHGLALSQLAASPDALLRDWAAELLAALPATTTGAFLRRARLRFDRARLQRLATRGGQGGFDDPAALPALWRAWQAARRR
jgi:hypothetical protein